MDRSLPLIEQEARTLLDRAFLYDDPDSYRAGVMAALRLVAEPAARSSA